MYFRRPRDVSQLTYLQMIAERTKKLQTHSNGVKDKLAQNSFEENKAGKGD